MMTTAAVVVMMVVVVMLTCVPMRLLDLPLCFDIYSLCKSPPPAPTCAVAGRATEGAGERANVIDRESNLLVHGQVSRDYVNFDEVLDQIRSACPEISNAGNNDLNGKQLTRRASGGHGGSGGVGHKYADAVRGSRCAGRLTTANVKMRQLPESKSAHLLLLSKLQVTAEPAHGRVSRK